MNRWWKTAKEVGPVSFAVKTFRELEIRSGLLAVLAPAHYYDTDVTHPRQSAFLKRTRLYAADALDTDALRAFYDEQPIAKELGLAFAEMVRLGSIRWFEESVDTEMPPVWHHDPFSDIEWPRRHYSQLLREPIGDFRTVWELGRMGFLLDLARAYVIDQDPRWATLFVSIFRSFVRENPYNEGVHWTNGQEVALRAMNVLFAMRVFGDAISDATYQELCNFLYWHGRYVHHHFEFAEDVLHNNHLIAEAIALNGLACFFREWPEAFEWGECGTRGLRQAVGQFPDEGGYCQASHSYHRFAIQLLLWAPSFGCDIEMFDLGFKKTDEMWSQLVDPETGEMANFGQNDGAWFGPRGAASLRDFRDTASALSFKVSGKRRFGLQEQGAWLFGEPYVSAAPRRSLLDERWRGGGLYLLRAPDTVGTTATVRTQNAAVRAGHEDLGHVDLTLNGRRVTLDSGSAVYLSERPESERGFSSGLHHCLMYCADFPLRRPLGQFSWQATDYPIDVTEESCSMTLTHGAFEGWSYGRTVAWEGSWLVTDRLEPNVLDEPREFVLRWILPYAEVVMTRVEDRWVIPFEGWEVSVRTVATTSPDVTLSQTVVAPHYRSREPALLLSMTFHTRDGCLIESRFEPRP